MKKFAILALLALAGASYYFDERVDLMGYDLPARKPIERRTGLDFVNDVNRATTVYATSATTASGQTIGYTGGNGCFVTTITARPL